MHQQRREVTGFGYCHLAMVPVRREPSHRSEMISQFLFGEAYTIHESRNSWTFVSNAFDDYEGWIDSGQVCIINEKDFLEAKENWGCSHELFFPCEGSKLPGSLFIPMGSSLPGIRDHHFRVGSDDYRFSGSYLPPSEHLDRQGIIERSREYLEAPYLWGGRTHMGIDCSGFTQIVYKLAGYRIPRDSSDQAGTGTTLNMLPEARAADLLFFDNEEGQIIHVGILMDNGQIIHASGKVRIDKIDHQGIFNEELQNYTHKLRVIKRILDI